MVTVDFLNVGHGDCTIIRHASGNTSMLDINNGDELDAKSVVELSRELRAADTLFETQVKLASAFHRGDTLLKEAGYAIELTNPVEFYKQKYGTQAIFRYIQTHPHLDHMRGLTALRSAGIGIVNMWDTNHNLTPALKGESDRAEWNEYVALRSGQRGATVLQVTRDATGPFYNQDAAGVAGGDGLSILAPTPELATAADEAKNPNNHSYVIKFVHRGLRFLFCGDAEAAVWDSIIAHYGEEVLKCDVLGASHHGRDSGYHQQAVKAMSPQYAIVSVGEKPETDACNKYRNYAANVWTTRWKGNISVTIDDTGKAVIDSEHDR